MVERLVHFVWLICMLFLYNFHWNMHAMNKCLMRFTFPCHYSPNEVKHKKMGILFVCCWHFIYLLAVGFGSYFCYCFYSFCFLFLFCKIHSCLTFLFAFDAEPSTFVCLFLIVSLRKFNSWFFTRVWWHIHMIHSNNYAAFWEVKKN